MDDGIYPRHQRSGASVFYACYIHAEIEAGGGARGDLVLEGREKRDYTATIRETIALKAGKTVFDGLVLSTPRKPWGGSNAI
ncbi:MAG: hypothetical protein LBL66_07255 [Clostridiales bacterium]|nr:hypothetical protein [Clostridiales bacterium]